MIIDNSKTVLIKNSINRNYTTISKKIDFDKKYHVFYSNLLRLGALNHDHTINYQLLIGKSNNLGASVKFYWWGFKVYLSYDELEEIGDGGAEEIIAPELIPYFQMVVIYILSIDTAPLTLSSTNNNCDVYIRFTAGIPTGFFKG